MSNVFEVLYVCTSSPILVDIKWILVARQTIRDSLGVCLIEGHVSLRTEVSGKLAQCWRVCSLSDGQ